MSLRGGAGRVSRAIFEAVSRPSRRHLRRHAVQVSNLLLQEECSYDRASTTGFATNAPPSAHYTCPGGRCQGSPGDFRERDEIRKETHNLLSERSSTCRQSWHRGLRARLFDTLRAP